MHCDRLNEEISKASTPHAKGYIPISFSLFVVDSADVPFNMKHFDVLGKAPQLSLGKKLGLFHRHNSSVWELRELWE